MTFESFLRQPFSEEELLTITKLEAEIHHQQERLGTLADEVVAKGVQHLSALRLRASSSLQRGDCAGWVEANSFIQSHIQHQRKLDWQSISQLSSLVSKSGGIIREQEIYTGPLQACPQSELEITILSFQENILANQKSYSALVHAALCQYWLVSIHPFLDGNGRTSILLTDWLLTKNGYLPQSFSSKVDAIVMYIPDRVKKMTPGMSVIKILQNVLRSYQCFN